VRFLKEALTANPKISAIRLREGEYQYALAKTIASFQLDLFFPDVKDITKKLYGEEKANDVQFIRKIQTILKKMEKSNLLTILPKKRPWELQKYALTSYRFQDVDKNLVVLANDEQVKHSLVLLGTTMNQKSIEIVRSTKFRRVLLSFALVTMIVALYGFIVWDFVQSVVDPLIFVPAFSIAIVCSILLGKVLSGEG